MDPDAKLQLPFCATYPIVSDPALAKRVRQHYHPYSSKEFVITAGRDEHDSHLCDAGEARMTDCMAEVA